MQLKLLAQLVTAVSAACALLLVLVAAACGGISI
jgi:hypothetical protein